MSIFTDGPDLTANDENDDDVVVEIIDYHEYDWPTQRHREQR